MPETKAYSNNKTSEPTDGDDKFFVLLFKPYYLLLTKKLYICKLNFFG